MCWVNFIPSDASLSMLGVLQGSSAYKLTTGIIIDLNEVSRAGENAHLLGLA